ncbi:cell division topological specificity factor MinE [Candidatus Poribacteria bacterium]|nr:cell division topological specificity factor MinE [Candidatus Poribacteria bacterium]|tara:strand:- start:1283 stop:1654 length:372 start_codon:yes stop_codon:yes gene_type:complete
MIQRLIQILTRADKSKDIAKSRLKLILVQDRLSISEEVMQSLQSEVTKLLSKYFTLNTDEVEMDLEREDNALALVANIPILGMKERENELNTTEIQKDNEPDTEKANKEQQTEKEVTEENDSN